MSFVIAVVGGAVGGLVFALVFARRRRRGVPTPEQTPRNPPATLRLVPIGGCRECGAPVGGGHTGYCSKLMMRSGVAQVVTEADCRHLTAGDMGMG